MLLCIQLKFYLDRQTGRPTGLVSLERKPLTSLGVWSDWIVSNIHECCKDKTEFVLDDYSRQTKSEIKMISHSSEPQKKNGCPT